LDNANIGAIVVLTTTGKLARLVAKYRPEVPIIACSPVIRVVRQMNYIRGVHGKQIDALIGAGQIVHHLAADHVKAG